MISGVQLVIGIFCLVTAHLSPHLPLFDAVTATAGVLNIFAAGWTFGGSAND